MLLDEITKGSTDRGVDIKILNLDGTPNESVVYNTSGLALWYRRAGAAKTTITTATLAALTTAHADGGFLHIDDGVYRLDVPDPAFATGANHVTFGGALTDCVVVGGRVKLIDVNYEDVVRFGLTSIPNVVTGNAGAIVTSGTGTAQLATTSGVVTDPSGVTTLLSRLSATRAGYLDNLAGVLLSDLDSGLSTLLTRLSATRAGYLDYLDRLNSMIELDGSVYRLTTNALELAPTGTGESPAVIAEAVWDFLTTDGQNVGSFGEYVQNISGFGSVPTTSEIVDALFADTSVEDGLAFRGIIRALLAVLVGETELNGTQRVFTNPSGGTSRVIATVPGDGSRTNINLNV